MTYHSKEPQMLHHCEGRKKHVVLWAKAKTTPDLFNVGVDVIAIDNGSATRCRIKTYNCEQKARIR